MITALLFQVLFTFLEHHGWFALKVDRSQPLASMKAQMEAVSRWMASEKVGAGRPRWNLGTEYPMAESEKVRTMAEPTETGSRQIEV
jgi:hypothetical protein